MAKQKKAVVSNVIRRSRGEQIFNVFNIIIMLFMLFICAYPFWYVICASFSNADALVVSEGMLWLPAKFDLLRKYFDLCIRRYIYSDYNDSVECLLCISSI